MTAPADRIAYDTLTALVSARPDQGTRRALHTALNGINDTERAMREKVTALRSALDAAEAALDAGYRADSHLIGHAAADLDRANTARDIHWATAAALLAQGELALLGVMTTT
jgi:hypothetical protein